MTKKKTPPKKAPTINFIIPLVVYPFDVMISVGQSDVQLGHSMDKYGLGEVLKDCDIELVRYTSDQNEGRAVIFPTNQSLLRIRKLPETAHEYATLAHEIFHIVTFILDRIGMKFVLLESDEAYAYLVGYLTEEIYKRINKYY